MRQRLTLNTPTQHPHTTQDDQATPKRDINQAKPLPVALLENRSTRVAESHKVGS
jgi:hypothetical protein